MYKNLFIYIHIDTPNAYIPRATREIAIMWRAL